MFHVPCLHFWSLAIFLKILDPLQLHLSTQHLSVATAIDNLCHPPLSCATLCILNICKIGPDYVYFLVTILNSSEGNAHGKTMFNSLAQTFWFDSFCNDSWVVATQKVTLIDSNDTTNRDILPWLVIRHNESPIFGIDFTS